MATAEPSRAMPTASSSTMVAASVITMTPPRFTSTTTRTPQSRAHMARSSSSRSDVSMSNDITRYWTPTQPRPLSSVEGKEGKGGMLAKSNIGDAERDLSSLFVENERKTGAKDTAASKRKKKGWGGSLVDGAVNATVFGVALSLTAYRMWTGEDSSRTPSTAQSPSSTAQSPSSSPIGTASTRSRPDSLDLPPPPAYTESNHPQQSHPPSPSPLSHRPGKDDEDGSWEDIRNPAALVYKKSPRSSPGSQLKHSRHRSKGSRSGMRRLKIPEREAVEMTVEESPSSAGHSKDPFNPDTVQVSAPEEAAIADGQESPDDILDPIEVLRRLDILGETLLDMIEEGKRALAAPSPVIASDGWIDDLGLGPAPTEGEITDRRVRTGRPSSSSATKTERAPSSTRVQVKRRSGRRSSGSRLLDESL